MCQIGSAFFPAGAEDEKRKLQGLADRGFAAKTLKNV